MYSSLSSIDMLLNMSNSSISTLYLPAKGRKCGSLLYSSIGPLNLNAYGNGASALVIVHCIS